VVSSTSSCLQQLSSAVGVDGYLMSSFVAGVTGGCIVASVSDF